MPSALVSISLKQIFLTISTASGVKRPKGAVKPNLESDKRTKQKRRKIIEFCHRGSERKRSEGTIEICLIEHTIQPEIHNYWVRPLQVHIMEQTNKQTNKQTRLATLVTSG